MILLLSKQNWGYHNKISMKNELNMNSELGLKIGTIIILFVLIYGKVISKLIETWTVRNDYSHGFLVPFISFYFIWAEKDRLANIEVKPSTFSGLIVILVSGVTLLLGNIAGIVIVQELSFFIMIPGLVLMLMGRKYLYALSLPILYLIAMMPIFDTFLEKIKWPFQLFSAKWAAVSLKLIGISTYQTENFIELPNVTLEVADVCSGVNFLFSIMALAIPVAYFTQKTLKWRVFLLILAFIISVCTNVLRVTLIGVWAFYFGGESIHGPNHIFQGFFVSVVGFAIFFGLSLLISDNSNNAERNDSLLSQNQVVLNISDRKKINNALRLALFLLITLLGVVYYYKAVRIPLRLDINTLPLQINSWKGSDLSRTEQTFWIKEADAKLVREYVSEPDKRVNLYIGYFETQTQDKELINYEWLSKIKNIHKAEITNKNKSFKVNIAELKTKEANGMALYSFYIDGHLYNNIFIAKFMTAINGLLRRETNGTLIVLTTNTGAQRLRDIKDFAEELLPLLNRHLAPKDI